MAIVAPARWAGSAVGTSSTGRPDRDPKAAHPGHLEGRIGAQPVGVLASLKTGGDHLHAEADHNGQALDGQVRAAQIVNVRAREADIAAVFGAMSRPEVAYAVRRRKNAMARSPWRHLNASPPGICPPSSIAPGVLLARDDCTRADQAPRRTLLDRLLTLA